MKPTRTIPSGKLYRGVPIVECGEALAPLPRDVFAFFEPHPYQALGAPYGGASPWMLRAGNVAALTRVQARLQALRPGWKLMIFDGYRPNAVQAFMVEREFGLQAREAGLGPAPLTAAQREALAARVFRLWGIPSEDPATPPLHSTGGCVDLTLMDEAGREVDMGSPVDENSDRSSPDYFATAADEAGRAADANRALLRDVMAPGGFQQFHTEWWHFGQGDQYTAWRRQFDGAEPQAVARYGRADLLQAG